MYLERIMQDNIQKIIKSIQQNISCPICKRKFLVGEIKVKGILDNVLVFSVQCQNGHATIQTLHIVLTNSRKTQIQNINIENIHKQIDNFDGDFIKLWKK